MIFLLPIKCSGRKVEKKKKICVSRFENRYGKHSRREAALRKKLLIIKPIDYFFSAQHYRKEVKKIKTPTLVSIAAVAIPKAKEKPRIIFYKITNEKILFDRRSRKNLKVNSIGIFF
jgi:hypothetical protein